MRSPNTRHGKPAPPKDEHGNRILCIQCRIKPIARSVQRFCSRSCAMASRGRSLAERFASRYTVGHPDECWIWRGTIHHRGYGMIVNEQNISLLAHRVAYERANGPIPNGLYVCHSCDTPTCVNPNHLFVGTANDNACDRDLKGRQARGQRNGLAKLTDDDVRDIRSMYPRMSQQAIADRFHVNQTIISDIVRRKTWKHI